MTGDEGSREGLVAQGSPLLRPPPGLPSPRLNGSAQKAQSPAGSQSGSVAGSPLLGSARAPPGLSNQQSPGTPELSMTPEPRVTPKPAPAPSEEVPPIHSRIIQRLKQYRALQGDRATRGSALTSLTELLRLFSEEARRLGGNGEVLDFQSLRSGTTLTQSIFVRNTTQDKPVSFSLLTIVPPRDEFAARVKRPGGGNEPIIIKPGEELLVEVSATGLRQYGHIRSDLLLVVNDCFVLLRSLTLRVKPATVFDFGSALYAEPYVPSNLKLLGDSLGRYAFAGLPPPLPDLRARFLQGLPPVPHLVAELDWSIHLPEVQPVLKPKLPGTLEMQTYTTFFRLLLGSELAAQVDRCARHQMYGAHVAFDQATTSRFGEMGLGPLIAVVEIPGLMDDQPRIQVGDQLRIRQQTVPFDGRDYWCPVWAVDRRLQRVYVAVNPQFPFHGTYNVRWEPDKASLGAAARAVKFFGEEGREEWLFPVKPERTQIDPLKAEAVAQPALGKIPTLDVYNAELNFEQRLAVERIVEDSYGPCPFVIFGPPGTGKTSTIVEAILQILQHRPDARILATAPSSSAADTILKRLIPHLMPKDLFRLCNPARTFAEVADDMLPYTASQSGYFTFPDKTKLMAFRVVVCTCFDAAFLVHLGLSNAQYEGTLAGYDDYARATFPIYHSAKPSSPHWTHCLVDECGQATEPEILIPMSVVFRKAPAGGAARAGRPPQLVLCGDHRQLGPRVVSDFAREKGLKRSLLERLHALPVYRDEDGHHGDFSAPFVHLRRNYRSHKSILMIPSQMYYNDSLLPFADDRVTESLLPWHELKGSEFPIAFFGVAGQDAGIGNGDSWYNDDEVAKVVDVVESLLADPAIKVKYEDFGVIAPFREQVRRIRLALRKKGHAAVNVGVVEDYQGMERKIIIISCVRSSQAFLERDMENDMGLVHSEQRFNVAITRAKALLVVVGDPNLLSTVESTWGTFLAFLFRHGCVHDAELPLQLQLRVFEAGLLERNWDTDLFMRRSKPLGAAYGDVDAALIESMVDNLHMEDGLADLDDALDGHAVGSGDELFGAEDAGALADGNGAYG